MNDDENRTRLKVCCIADVDEAELAVKFGADAIGLVGAMPSGPGIITDETAYEIVAAVPSQISSFLLTSEIKAKAIAAHVEKVGANTVQVVSHIDPVESEKLATLLPNIKRVQVLHVEGSETPKLIDQYKDFYDAFLLDSGRPSLAVPELGGTDRTHDWRISRKIVKQSPLPVFLAGGLNPANIFDAVTAVRPYGIDVCSGLRTNEQLDGGKLAAFVENIRQADARSVKN